MSYINDITDSFSNIPPLSPATHTQLLQQDEPRYDLPFLTQIQTRAFLAQLGNLRTLGDYTYVDEYGRVGKFQFSYVGLQSLGLIKSSIETNIDLRWQYAWPGGQGPSSLDGFLNNHPLQDRAALDIAKFNYGHLTANGTLLEEDSPGKQAGIVMVAHFLTPTLTYYWRRNSNISAENKKQLDKLAGGLDLARIYRAGRYAVEVLPTIS